jgi:hypothetical protein
LRPDQVELFDKTFLKPGGTSKASAGIVVVDTETSSLEMVMSGNVPGGPVSAGGVGDVLSADILGEICG